MYPTPSRITYGMAELGRHARPGSGQEENAVQVVEDLLRNSNAFIDTSNNYTDGRSEAIIGQALRRVGTRAHARIITKVDRNSNTWRFDHDRVLASFDESTARLGMDTVPLVHLHDPYTTTFEHAMGPKGAVSALLRLQEEGRIQSLGVATGPVPVLRPYLETGLFQAILCHSRFNLIDRSAQDMFTDAKTRGMTVFNAAPFGAGILARGDHDNAMFAYLQASAELRQWVRNVEALCTEYDVPIRALALQFSIRSPLVDSTVVGAVSPGRRQQLEELAEHLIPEELWGRLGNLPDAPSTIDDNDPRRIRLYLGLISAQNYWNESREVAYQPRI